MIEPGGLEEYLRLRAGPEPLSPEWAPRRCCGPTCRAAGADKALLLHQGIVAGVGNIYADEALWEARIHPCGPAGA